VSAIRCRRLALALLVARAPNLLALDEPTNHNSLALADALRRARRGRQPRPVAAPRLETPRVRLHR